MKKVSLFTLCDQLKERRTIEERLALLEKTSCAVAIETSSQEERYLLLQLSFIDQLPPTSIPISTLLPQLKEIDAFYYDLGGLIGYQSCVLKLLQKETVKEEASYHAPTFVDISSVTDSVQALFEEGIDALEEIGMLFPLGGAADRLQLVDEKTGEPLPAAMLQYSGRTLLEGLIRDVEALEASFYRRHKKKITIPIAMMVSEEKQNATHVRSVLEKNNWFSRAESSFRFFIQPQVPLVDSQGSWCYAKQRLLVKPGGHGAIWKLAKDRGVFSWLESEKKTKLLVRQINNPIAGIDYGLLAFLGWGHRHKQQFGFASCPRVIRSAEGVNVIKKSASGKIALTNIEYCDFAKYNIEDLPLEEGGIYSRFSSNTNVLFAEIAALSKAVEKEPFPGLLLNPKRITIQGQKEPIKAGRLESTMQNIADVFEEDADSTLRTKRTFVTYNVRHKTIATVKKLYQGDTKKEETAENCFYVQQKAAKELLSFCGFTLPEKRSFEEVLSLGPDLLFLYHPALGPLYQEIAKKLKQGSIQMGSFLEIELEDIQITSLDLKGALSIRATHPVLHPVTPRCALTNIQVLNEGISWKSSHPFWKGIYQPKQSVQIYLHGTGSIEAKNLHLEGSHTFEVPDQMHLRLWQEEGKLHSQLFPQ